MASIRCAYCHAGSGPALSECKGCRTRLHPECFEILGSCPTLGCHSPPPIQTDWTSALGLVAFTLFALLLVLAGYLVVVCGEGRREARATHASQEGAPSLGQVVACQPPTERKERTRRPNPEFSSWVTCGSGSFVEFDVATLATRSITLVTVAAIASDRVLLETRENVFLPGERIDLRRTSRIVFASAEESDHAPEPTDVPSRVRGTALYDLSLGPAAFEEIEVAGRRLRCQRAQFSTCGSLPMQSTLSMCPCGGPTRFLAGCAALSSSAR
jgi:hypothetical protein